MAPDVKSWKLKTTEEGHVELKDGLPVWIDPEGQELNLNAPDMYGKILDLGKESKKHREKVEELQTTLKIFEDVEDLPKWVEDAKIAMETVANFNEKEWLEVDKVNNLKKDMKDAFDQQLADANKSFGLKENDYKEKLSAKDAHIRKLMVSNKFATSPWFVGENRKTILAPEFAEAYYGKFFKVEENSKTGEISLVAYYPNQEQVYSKKNPGELASFDEAIGLLIESDPKKDQILRSQGGGSGAGDGVGGGEESNGDEMSKLQQMYKAAQEKQDSRAMIAIKNKMAALRQKQKNS